MIPIMSEGELQKEKSKTKDRHHGNIQEVGQEDTKWKGHKFRHRQKDRRKMSEVKQVSGSVKNS